MATRPIRRGRPKRKIPARKTTVTRHASLPTSRNAYIDTREWLLEQHGPTCAYCGGVFAGRSITLDHVTPRRGQSAYDRRDNLVLACTRCNAQKADKPFLVYLLAQRSRAERLLRYGQHLSEGILTLLRHMVGDVAMVEASASSARRTASRQIFGPDDDESPYAEESPYRATA